MIIYDEIIFFIPTELHITNIFSGHVVSFTSSVKRQISTQIIAQIRQNKVDHSVANKTILLNIMLAGVHD